MKGKRGLEEDDTVEPAEIYGRIDQRERERADNNGDGVINKSPP